MADPLMRAPNAASETIVTAPEPNARLAALWRHDGRFYNLERSHKVSLINEASPPAREDV